MKAPLTSPRSLISVARGGTLGVMVVIAAVLVVGCGGGETATEAILKVEHEYLAAVDHHDGRAACELMSASSKGILRYEGKRLIRDMGAVGASCPVVLNRLFSLMGGEKAELFEQIRPAMTPDNIEVTGRTAVLKFAGRQTSYEMVDGRWMLAGFPAVDYTERFLVPSSTERTLSQDLNRALQSKVEAVRCPDRIFAVAGKTILCTVTLRGGRTARATLLLRERGYWVKELVPTAAKLNQRRRAPG